MKKKNLFIVFVLIMLFLISCDNAGKPENLSNDSDVEQVEPENEAEKADGQFYPDLPEMDFGGYEFVFFTRIIDSPDHADWWHRDLIAEEENGDLINDAVYKRNVKVMDKYNFKIKQIDTSYENFVKDVRAAVSAGDSTYDAVMSHTGGAEYGTVAQEGLLCDLFKMPHMDMSNPWWNQGVIRDLSIGGKLYAVQGDLTIKDNDAMTAMIFNKKLIRDFELEDPYKLVKDGKWTLDKMHEMGKTVSDDLNGDGKMYIQDDRFGIILQADCTCALLYGAGERIAAKDENGYLIPTFSKDRVYSVMDTIARIMLDSDNVINLHNYEGKFPVYEEQVKMFQEDRALFSWIRMRIVEQLRGMETDFGILPQPKFNESQENYWSHINSAGDAVTVLVSNENLERTGIILEALSAESRYTLQPAYYDLNLYGKYVRDEESRDMLEIILNNTMHDLGAVYNVGGFFETVLWSTKNKKTEYASMYEKAESKILGDIEKVNDNFKNIGN